MVQAASLAVQLYEELRRRIGDGCIAAGARLSTTALANEFRISQTPVREALARLHADGLAEFSANRGYRVAAAPDDIAYGHWMEARIAIEGGAMRLLRAPVDSGLLRRLEEVNASIRRAQPRLSAHGEARRFAEANLAFHGALVEAAGNPFLLRAWRQIAQAAQFSRTHLRAGGVLDRDLIVEEHARIITALRCGDIASAAQALRDHIADSIGRDRKRGAAGEAGKTTEGEKTHAPQTAAQPGRRPDAAGRPPRRGATGPRLA